MITQRFRPVFWVAGVAVAATGLYMVSLRVATERGRLEAIDREIARTERDIRQLQTELGTRASLRQLEKWNGEALALTAPKAGQFLPNIAALASVDPGKMDGKNEALPPVMVASSVAQPLRNNAEQPIAIPVHGAAPIATRSDKVALLDKALLPKVAISTLQPKPKIERAKAATVATTKTDRSARPQ
jgi:hypothetical protein